MDTLTSISPAPEIAIRAWALQDEEVRLHLERTDRARLEIGQRWFQTVTNDEGKANLMARMLNSLLVGCYSVIPPVLGEELRELMGEFFRLYGLNGRSS